MRSFDSSPTRCLMKRLALLVLVAFTPVLRADVKLPAVFGNQMVIQRDAPLPVWGTAGPGEDVMVQFDDEKASTKADDKGNWKVSLTARQADGKAHTITVSGKNKIELTDILI